MSFSNLFAKLSDVEEQEPRHRNDISFARGSSRKRKPLKEQVPYTKRQCLRSCAVDVTPEEEPTAPGAHRHESRKNNDHRPNAFSGWHYNHKNTAFRSNDSNKGNRSKANNQKNKNVWKKKQENPRRYKNFNKDKNADFTQPQTQFMTQEFKDQNVIEVEGRFLCKHFILGRCTKGEECKLEHTEGYNDLLKVACKFYIQGNCYKRAACPYMHKSVPCKFFHKKGNCKSDDCRFSHDPLTDLTQKILDEVLQRDHEFAELKRKTEEPVHEAANEEQNTNEDIVTPVIRPSFYQSSESAVEDQALVSRTDPQSDVTEEVDVAQTVSNIESEDPLPSAASDQAGAVCYSVEAILGPQLFRPVLYSATQSPKSELSQSKTKTETERLLNPVEAPYSVANVLRSQSGYTSHLCTPPAAALCELKETRTMNNNYSVSHLDSIQHQRAHGNSSNHPPFYVTAASGHYEKPPNDTKTNCEAIKNKELPVDKLDECAQGSKQSENTTMTPLIDEKPVSDLPKKSTTMQQNLKETTCDQSSHSTQRQDGPSDANLSPCDKTASRFSNLFANLNSDTEQIPSASCSFRDRLLMPKAKKSDPCSQKVHQATKPNQFANSSTKHTHNGSCGNQEGGLFRTSTLASHDKSQKPGSFSAELISKGLHKEDTGRAKSFQSLFTSLTAEVDRTVTDASTFSDKRRGSSGKKLKKSSCEPQFMEDPLEMMDSNGSSSNKEAGIVIASPETSNSASQKPVSSSTLNSKGQSKKDCLQIPETPGKSFQSLFASLTPEAVSGAQDVEKSEWVDCGFYQATETSPGCKRGSAGNKNNNKGDGFVATYTEISNESHQKSVSPSLIKEDETERAKTPTKSFQSLFVAPLNESAANNNSQIGLTELPQSMDSTLSQSKRLSPVSVNKMAEESKFEQREVASSPSSNVSNQTSASPQHQPHTGPVSLVFKTLFRQLRPYEQQGEHQDYVQSSFHPGSKTDGSGVGASNVQQKKRK